MARPLLCSFAFVRVLVLPATADVLIVDAKLGAQKTVRLAGLSATGVMLTAPIVVLDSAL
jgi:hypothetical protein